MRAMKIAGMFLFAGVLSVCLLSCAHGRKSAEAPAFESNAAADATGNEAILLGLVKEHVAAASRNAGEQKNRVVRRKPYFFKQYDVYPEGTEGAKAVVQAQESRSIPWVGDVSLPKQRFITRFHAKRRDAEDDTNFLRETGRETITFELRSGRWVRVGSLFVAEKSEEYVNGEWVPVKETVKRTPASEDRRKGFFGRTWDKLLGRHPYEEEPAKKEKPEENPAAKQQRTIQPGRAF